MKQEELHTTFINLIREYERIIYKICYLYTRHDADRQDLYQEIVAQVWKAYPKFRGDAKFSTWLYQIAINTALAGIRLDKRSVISSTPDGSLPDTSDIGADELHTEQLELLHKAINQLNDLEKAIVIVYLDSKSYDEMESIFGIPNGALRVKMTRIKEKLRKITKADLYGTE